MTAQELEAMREQAEHLKSPVRIPDFLQFEIAIQLACIREQLWELTNTLEAWYTEEHVDRPAELAPPAETWPPRCGVPLDNDRTCDAPAEHIDLVGRLYVCDRHHGEQASVRRVLTGGIPQ